MRYLLTALALGSVSAAASAQGSPTDRATFRAIYQELVEIDSSEATGSCTRAAAAMAARLRAAGYSDNDLKQIAPEGKPDDGNVVAVLRGASPDHAILLLAHLDVVNANRADWQRDPFKLVEENGYFYGRGAADDKSMAAVFVDLMVRFRREGLRPRRSIKLALTCGEETSNRIDGADYLLNHNREWLQADFALNEGAGGILSADGKPVALTIQAGEKIHQAFTLTITNPGGHSSRPVPDNAIYRLSAGLGRLSQFQFPVELNSVTRGFFERMAPIVGGDMGAAMTALARNPADAAAAAVVARDPSYNAIMRTTCVATQLEAGHATNALPQRAVATLSCRVLQGHSADEVKADLQKALADPQIDVVNSRPRAGSKAPALTPEIMGPVERAAQRIWPKTPIIPTMLAGATDGRFLNSAGIPTYGVSGMFDAPGETNAHGLNEKIRVKSLYEGRQFLELVVREYAQK